MNIVEPVKSGMRSKRLGRIVPFLQHYVDKKKLAGFVSLVARRGQTVHFETIGDANFAAGRPMEPDTIFSNIFDDQTHYQHSNHKDNLWTDNSGIPFYDYSDENPYYRSLEILRMVKETVGMDRMMWVSDFPTVLKLGTYHQCIDLVTKHGHFLTTDDLEKLMSTNAMKVHFNYLKS